VSKRFPIPEFDRDYYKNMQWKSPTPVSASQQKDLIERAGRGDASAFGSYAVHADDAFFDRFSVRGASRQAMMCLTPRKPVRMLGRSWAWYIQRALVVDSLHLDRAQVIQDWTTPRPMNTRLGPQDGVEIPGGPVYALFGHRYSDYWIPNRAMQDPRPSQSGFSLISNSDDANNDFHSCNLTFSWT
jgi:hypothetical protein